jgi:endonuclease G
VKRILVFIAGLLLLTGCGEDTNDYRISVPEKGQDNPPSPILVNANGNVAGQYQEVTRLEFPKVRVNDTNSVLLLRYTTGYGLNYSIEYDLSKKAMRWVCFTFDSKNSQRNWSRKQWEYTDNPWSQLNYQTYKYYDPFQPDLDLSAEARAELTDYPGSGYQRGHVCASSDRLCSRDANEQTYYLSNIMPQTYELNNGIWQDMEGYVNGNNAILGNGLVSWNDNAFRDTLYVCKGGTIDDANILKTTSSGLTVPKYYFMALLCLKDGRYKALAFWVEHTTKNQKGDDITKYVISVDELERKTGQDFFCNLPDELEEHVESVSKAEILKEWGLQ